MYFLNHREFFLIDRSAFKLVKIEVALPVSSAACERNIRNSMANNRLDSLGIFASFFIFHCLKIYYFRLLLFNIN